MQSKPIRNSDFDAHTAKHVTFFNENFKRGRCDLLKKIQRSTRGGGGTPGQDQQREVQDLKVKISSLENTISEMGNQMEERMRRLELDMLGRMEQMMLAMQHQQQSQLSVQGGSTNNASSDPVPKVPRSNPSVSQGGANISGQNGLAAGLGWDPLPNGARGTSIGSMSGLPSFAAPPVPMGMTNNTSTGAGPTLPPHPKQKQLMPQNLPGALAHPPGRLNSLRGISGLSRGISGLSRGASMESQSSALLSNTWEDKFFSMLMSGDKAGAVQAAQDSMNPTPMADPTGLMNRNGMNAALLSRVSSVGQQSRLGI
jgi:hypothetical protein